MDFVLKSLNNSFQTRVGVNKDVIDFRIAVKIKINELRFSVDHIASIAGYSTSKMNNPFGDDHDEATVVGFEVPNSPESSYNTVFPLTEDESRDPPQVPPHLQHTLLNLHPSRDPSGSLPSPPNVILNHLYLENRETLRSVVALGITHRFHSKFVTVVLYKPVQRRGSAST